MHISSKVATAVILDCDEIRYLGAAPPDVAEAKMGEPVFWVRRQIDSIRLVTLADIFEKVGFEWRNE